MTGLATQIAIQNGRIDGLTTQMTIQTGRIDGLTTQMTIQTDRIDALIEQLNDQAAISTARHQELISSMANCNAKFYNRRAHSANSEILPLCSNKWVNSPAIFPETRGALFKLSATECTELLNIYSLPVNGTIGVKRNRLAAYIGLTI